ncbi:unnamed protein product [Bursaphelenchus xylophilus]|uniref:(pine wood nematode) hypothetical protein n=1 Tax=Bursaphelenchus xylophilus TaxID=6326 RepID=A0A1I7SS36_BURXY|nr:unnamed protein product [Bursaphelenchus xylophilus]CAG9105725.1 unnamed protein product [Bursaphelenchus xylophilus]
MRPQGAIHGYISVCRENNGGSSRLEIANHRFATASRGLGFGARQRRGKTFCCDNPPLFFRQTDTSLAVVSNLYGPRQTPPNLGPGRPRSGDRPDALRIRCNKLQYRDKRKDIKNDGDCYKELTPEANKMWDGLPGNSVTFHYTHDVRPQKK